MSDPIDHAVGAPAAPLFASFFQGGFECSTHRERDNRRLDLIASTAHDRFARADYEMLRSVGVRTVRDGLRWHRIEGPDGRFDWSSFTPMLLAAAEAGVEVVWDLLHFGWPDHLDVWSGDFPARFAAAALERIRLETGATPKVTPVNEISFLSWAGGDHAIFNPMGRGRGDELKRQLVRCAIAAMRAMRAIDPAIRFTHTDPAINVVANPALPGSAALARERTEAQFQAWDMIAGRLHPELGGRPEFLDVISVNYYCHNQWLVEGPPLDWQVAAPGYTRPRELFARIHRRYGRPLYVSETGIEAELRPAWLRYICDEAFAAIADGVPIHGLCLYPVMNHPGWVDDRHCPNGLIDYDRASMARTFDAPMLAELLAQMERLATFRSATHGAAP
jgi:hypothetical protein